MKNPTAAKGKARRLPLRARVAIISVAVGGGLLIAGIAIYYLVYVVKPAPQVSTDYNPYQTQLNELSRQPVPTDPISRAIYYAQLAQNYEHLGNKDSALDSYLQAQHVIDDNNLSDQIVYYEAIANAYQQKGDMIHSYEYLQKYKNYLLNFLKEHPGDAATEAAITNVDERLQKK